jgi:hypothetical protein
MIDNVKRIFSFVCFAVAIYIGVSTLFSPNIMVSAIDCSIFIMGVAIFLKP